jgi:hypothetical protein
MDIKDIYGLSILILLLFDDPKKILGYKRESIIQEEIKKMINN